MSKASNSSYWYDKLSRLIMVRSLKQIDGLYRKIYFWIFKSTSNNYKRTYWMLFTTTIVTIIHGSFFVWPWIWKRYIWEHSETLSSSSLPTKERKAMVVDARSNILHEVLNRSCVERPCKALQRDDDPWRQSKTEMCWIVLKCSNSEIIDGNSNMNPNCKCSYVNWWTLLFSGMCWALQIALCAIAIEKMFHFLIQLGHQSNCHLGSFPACICNLINSWLILFWQNTCHDNVVRNGAFWNCCQSIQLTMRFSFWNDKCLHGRVKLKKCLSKQTVSQISNSCALNTISVTVFDHLTQLKSLGKLWSQNLSSKSKQMMLQNLKCLLHINIISSLVLFCRLVLKFPCFHETTHVCCVLTKQFQVFPKIDFKLWGRSVFVVKWRRTTTIGTIGLGHNDGRGNNTHVWNSRK